MILTNFQLPDSLLRPPWILMVLLVVKRLRCALDEWNTKAQSLSVCRLQSKQVEVKLQKQTQTRLTYKDFREQKGERIESNSVPSFSHSLRSEIHKVLSTTPKLQQNDFSHPYRFSSSFFLPFFLSCTDGSQTFNEEQEEPKNQVSICQEYFNKDSHKFWND